MPVVLVATLNEAFSLGRTLDSLLAQEQPIRVLVVDSASTDGTQQVARGRGVEVLDAPRGKLTALDFALRGLRPDVALLADGDKVYPPAWTRLMLAPFRNANVAMTTGVCDALPEEWLHPYFWLSAALEGFYALTRHVWGGNSAIRGMAYEQVGGYNLGIDQKDFLAVYTEEEWRLPAAIQERIGDVELVPQAVVGNSARRHQLFPTDPGFLARKPMTF